jgi:hypothetical protein
MLRQHQPFAPTVAQPSTSLWQSIALVAIGIGVAIFTSQLAQAKTVKSPAKPNQADERIYLHTAIKGDTFGKLAQRYLVNRADYNTLTKYNVNTNPNAIPIGSAVRIPVSAMRADFAAAEVVTVSGQAALNGGKIAQGQKLSERDKVSTGDGGFVTLKLVDGSTITVQSKSSVEIERSRQLANTSVGESVIKLESGRLESSVTKQNAAARYEIRTPTSNMGVRGTVFRAAADPANKKALSEVVEGAIGVSVATASPANGLALPAGFGTAVEEGKAPTPPVKLLPAPLLSPSTDVETRANVAIEFPSVAGANGYRALVALDAAFLQPVAEVVARSSNTTTTAKVNIDNLPDGNLFLRVRAIDAAGLEGINAEKKLTVAARPFAPTLVAPLAESSISPSQVQFVWNPVNKSAPTKTRLQIARDARFTNIVVDQKEVTTSPFLLPETLAPGSYFWRMASVELSGREGPFGDVSTFAVKPSRIVINKKLEGSLARFSWQGEVGARYQYQVSRRETFTDIVLDRVITESNLNIEGLPKNTYFVRVRQVAAGSTPEKIIAPNEWSQWVMVEIFG